MVKTQAIHDPSGRTVFVPPAFLMNGDRNFKDIERVVSAPAFLIEAREGTLYFFRLLHWDLNILVEARAVEEDFVVVACHENPNADYIAGLLQKGRLTSFL